MGSELENMFKYRIPIALTLSRLLQSLFRGTVPRAHEHASTHGHEQHEEHEQHQEHKQHEEHKQHDRDGEVRRNVDAVATITRPLEVLRVTCLANRAKRPAMPRPTLRVLLTSNRHFALVNHDRAIVATPMPFIHDQRGCCEALPVVGQSLVRDLATRARWTRLARGLVCCDGSVDELWQAL